MGYQKTGFEIEPQSYDDATKSGTHPLSDLDYPHLDSYASKLIMLCQDLYTTPLIQWYLSK